VPVPEVVGGGEDEATSTLEDAGFVVQRAVRAVNDPARVGQVLEQSPAAETRVAPGTTVTITVGERAAPTTTTTTTTTRPPGGGGGGGGGNQGDGGEDGD
jgi:serine/threonine-protein kinase